MWFLCVDTQISKVLCYKGNFSSFISAAVSLGWWGGGRQTSSSRLETIRLRVTLVWWELVLRPVRPVLHLYGQIAHTNRLPACASRYCVRCLRQFCKWKTKKIGKINHSESRMTNDRFWLWQSQDKCLGNLFSSHPPPSFQLFRASSFVCEAFLLIRWISFK